MKPLTKLVFGLVMTITALSAAAQELPEADVKRLVEGKNFLFVPQTMTPQPASFRSLNGFELAITPDSLISYLPYFGRSFAAPVSTTRGPLDFTSLKFDYSMTLNRKGNWEVTIRPKDGRDVQQMDLTVFSNGRASLRVNSLNRQFVSFNGYIQERPGQKKAF